MVEKRVYPPIPKYFNTTGPCEAGQHYMVPPLPRVPEAPGIVAMGGYFVLHAPRQSGKTTFLRAFARSLTAGGDYAALYMSCEAAEAKGDDEVAAQRLLARQLVREAEAQLTEELRPDALPADLSSDRLLTDVLSAWCARCPRRVVLLLDEVDALRGQSLIAVLRQLRAGFPDRPHRAPWSVMLCGLRDVRDYKLASGGDAQRLGTSSPFNVKLESLTLGTFSEAEVRALLGQHTAATGQAFEDAAIARLTELAGGQPWLVNALGWEIVSKMRVTGPIERRHVEAAKERLILARATHLDSLTSKLAEPRVRRVIEPLLSGELAPVDAVFDDDVSYVVDLGLVKNPPLRVANEIYREVIARVLSSPAQSSVTADPRRFVRADGRFDLDVLVSEFAAFWVEQGESMVEGATYAESGAQLVLMAYLQRVVNGGGVVSREYGVGRRRIDLLIEWPYTDAAGTQQTQREAIELKVWRDKRKDPLAEGLKQLDEYLARVGLDAGVLVLFDRRSDAPPLEERVREERAVTPSGRAVRVLRA
jgi:hypothetical protein